MVVLMKVRIVHVCVLCHHHYCHLLSSAQSSFFFVICNK